MSNRLKQITTRAKSIRKSHPGMKWTACIKKASAELNGKVAGTKTKKAKYRQTGSSTVMKDIFIKAKAPGKRRSKSGVVYYERRKNRSDKPGSMLGIGSLKSELKNKLESRLGDLMVKHYKTQSIR